MLICVSFALLFSACGNGTKTDDPERIEPPKSGITLDKSEIDLFLGDTKYIVANYTTVAGEKVSFSSSDARIASIDGNGLVTAENIGETNIIVTYAGDSAECKVKVIAGDYLPSIRLNYVVGDEISVSMTDRANLASYVLFNGKEFADGTFTYTFDENLGRVENGFFIPEREGETTLTIQGAWRGFGGGSLQKTLKVKVIFSFDLYVNDGAISVNLHNRERVGTDYYGKTEIDFVVNCFENGVAIDDYLVVITEGNDIISYDEETQTVRVLNEKTGNAKIVVTATDKNGETHARTVSITVMQSAPPNEGYFNPIWVADEIDCGYFSIQWILE